MTIEQSTRAVKRPYDSRRRREQARRHRTRILEAARARFLERGYAATTLSELAADADASVGAIYKMFGNKAGLLKAIFDVALAGDEAPVTIADRAWVAEITAEPEARRKLRMYAQHFSAAISRAAPIQLLARTTAAADPEIDAVWRQIGAERLEGMSGFAGHLATGGHLREGVSSERARDVLWTYTSVHLYELLVLERGWTVDQYRDFIADALSAALVPNEPPLAQATSS